MQLVLECFAKFRVGSPNPLNGYNALSLDSVDVVGDGSCMAVGEFDDHRSNHNYLTPIIELSVTIHGADLIHSYD